MNAASKEHVAAPAVAYAHIVVGLSGVTLDTSASYQVTGAAKMLPTCSAAQCGAAAAAASVRGICIYGNFKPTAVVATPDVGTGAPPSIAVSTGASWMPSWCSQGAKNAAGETISGHVVGFLRASVSPPSNGLVPGQGNRGPGSTPACGQDTAHYVGPSHCEQGYFVIFY
ncbi:MAG TPA: hypothetical protein VGL76_05835 [Gaiellaceae bacterium]